MFLQFHILTAFPPHNVNRDEDGRPKVALYGGVQRGRISSQARKRAIRMAGQFSGYEWVEGQLRAPGNGMPLRATRTREAGLLAYDRLREKGVAAFPAVLAAQAVLYAIGGATSRPPLSSDDKPAPEGEDGDEEAGEAEDPPETAKTRSKGKGKSGNKKPFENLRAAIAKLQQDHADPTELRQVLCAKKKAGEGMIVSNQGLVVSTRELARLQQKLNELAAIDEASVLAWAKGIADNPLLSKDDIDEDLALFGRMVAAKAKFTEEASVSLSHAITTHAWSTEGDYFSAGEELNLRGGTGAAITDYAFFGGGVYYQHAVVDMPHLLHQLCGDRARAARALKVLVHGLATAQPGGKRHAFASDVCAGWIGLDAGRGATCNLALAFLKPVTADEADGDLFAASVARLQVFREALASAYGRPATCDYVVWPALRAGRNEPRKDETWTLESFQQCVLQAAELAP